MSQIQFIVYASPAPQGSMKAFVVNGKARITHNSEKTRPFRDQLARAASYELAQRNLPAPLAGRHVPVSVRLEFHVKRPPSIPKKRKLPSVPPDCDKMVRAVFDAMKGFLYVDDAQVVELVARKHYAVGPEYVAISATVVPITGGNSQLIDQRMGRREGMDAAARAVCEVCETDGWPINDEMGDLWHTPRMGGGAVRCRAEPIYKCAAWNTCSGM